MTPITPGIAKRLRAYCCAVAIAAAPFEAAWADEADRFYDFDVSGPTLGDALAALVEETEATVLYSPELADITGLNPVIGRYTLRDAVAILFEGTPLVGSITGNGVIIIRRAPDDEETMDDTDIAIETPTNTAEITAEAPEPIEAPPEPDRQAVIVVTGTRIDNPNIQSPNPIYTLPADEIARTGRLNIAQVLQTAPALIATEQIDTFSDGIRLLNLRNLGSPRTLTLVDSKRFVAGSAGSPGVDVGNIPIPLIERIDVLTGGTSAVYGADAAAGVVNFILKDDFDGISIRGQTGGSTQAWDAREHSASIVAGKNVLDGDANLTASYTFFGSDSLRAVDRDFASTEFAPLLNNATGNGPLAVHIPGARSTDSPEIGASVALFTPAPNSILLTNSGDIFNQDRLTGDGVLLHELVVPQLRPRTERHIVTLGAQHKARDFFQPYADLHFARSELASRTRSSRISVFDQPLDGPFVPQAITDRANAEPLVFLTQIIRVERDFAFTTDLDVETFRVVTGVEGHLADSLRYDVSVNIGRNDTTEREITQLQDRLAAALDVVVDPASGDIVCASDLDPAAFSFPAPRPSFAPGPDSGCAPYNLFSTVSGENQAALEFIFVPTFTKVDTEQDVVNGFLAGDLGPLGLTLPGGDIEYVLGGEYRQESGSSIVDPLVRRSAGFAEVQNDDQRGSFNVAEVFGEVSLPILADIPYADSLTLSGAFRYSDYSTSGGEWTYNAGAIWAPSPDLKLRGTFARAVRAPSLGELFAPTIEAETFALSGEDPCDTEAPAGGVAPVDSGSDTRRANCASALSALGVDPDTFQSQAFHIFDLDITNNPELEPETSDTFTIGFIAQPRYIDGLTITADYYDITISGAISLPSETFTINQCYDAPTLDNAFCDLVERATTPSILGGRAALGEVSRVVIADLNLAKFERSGVEFSLNYVAPPTPFGDFSFKIAGHYLDKAIDQPTPDPASRTDRAGIGGRAPTIGASKAPRWTINTDILWAHGDWDANLAVNYHNRVLREANVNRDIADQLTSDPFLDPLWNVQAQVGFQVNEQARVYVGADNLLDQEPDIGSVLQPISAVGRYAYLGFALDFPPQ